MLVLELQTEGIEGYLIHQIICELHLHVCDEALLLPSTREVVLDHLRCGVFTRAFVEPYIKHNVFSVVCDLCLRATAVFQFIYFYDALLNFLRDLLRHRQRVFLRRLFRPWGCLRYCLRRCLLLLPDRYWGGICLLFIKDQVNCGIIFIL
jgi:hypothetical protein